MSTLCLDHTHFVSDADPTDQEKSSLSTLFSVPYHPPESIAQKHEDIRSILKGLGVLNDSALSFEYVVVGGGTAGLVVASRLAEGLQAGQYVCVVEAGMYRQDALIDVPGMYGKAGGKPDYDWSYRTIPQENLNGRRVHSSAGRLLGGSSAINFLVRMRASSPEYDAWKTFGTGWDWQCLLPYFKVEESYEAYEWGTPQIFPGVTDEEDQVARKREREFRGDSGFVHSTHNTVYTDLLVPTINTTLSHGIKTNRTPGYGDSTGMFNIDTVVNREKGTRCYAANAYLRDPTSTVPQPNVIILKGIYATKILFSNDGAADAKAIGVTCLGGVDWKSPASPTFAFDLTVERELIVSAGSYSTPRLLELSGIGNPDILKQFDIEPVVGLRGVGENLQEHPYLASDFIVKEGVFTFDRLRNDPIYRAQQEKEYRDNKTGAYATTVSAYGFIKLKNFLTKEEVRELKGELDKEVSRAGNAFHKCQLQIQRKFLENDGVGDIGLMIVEKSFATSPPQEGKSYISLAVSLSHPVARGSVHISSSDPLEPPRINPHYLNNAYDTKIMTKAARFVRRLSETEPLKSIIVAPSTPGSEVQTEAQFEEFVRQRLVSMQHPMGTSCFVVYPS